MGVRAVLVLIFAVGALPCVGAPPAPSFGGETHWQCLTNCWAAVWVASQNSNPHVIPGFVVFLMHYDLSCLVYELRFCFWNAFSLGDVLVSNAVFAGMQDAVRQARNSGQQSGHPPLLGDGTPLEGLGREAYVTLVATPDYLVGAEVIAKCLLRSKTSRPMLALVGDMLRSASIHADGAAIGDGNADIDGCNADIDGCNADSAAHIQQLRDSNYHILRVPPVLTAPTEPEYARPLLNSTLLKLHLFGLKSHLVSRRSAEAYLSVLRQTCPKFST